MQRSQAREFVLSALYRREFIATPLEEMLAEIKPGEQRSYIERVFSGILGRREEIDAMIGSHTIGWRFERLGLIDRNILRIGVYELLYDDDIPPEVAIDQAVELAKRYGTEQARVFVNGILDRIWKEERERKVA
ncbi:transcription antitermination factor NusB [Candidatus Acetothermia bacterium]|nr:MAG: transcription antitermination factor NusB [Candidatus Acetothermia bacterium]